jgi:hypothetical protein
VRKQSSVIGDAVPRDVVAQDRHEFRRDRYRSRLLGPAMLEPSFVVGLPRVGVSLAALRPVLAKVSSPQPS